MDFLERKCHDSAIDLKVSLVESSFFVSEKLAESNKFIKYSNDQLEVGFIYYDVGLEPQLELLTRTNKVFLGVNKMYACLDYEGKAILFKKELPSLLYEIMIDSDVQYILYICELDIVVYKNDGSFLWKMGFRDIIENYYLKENKSVVIEYSTGDKINFSLESGKIE